MDKYNVIDTELDRLHGLLATSFSLDTVNWCREQIAKLHAALAEKESK